MSSLSELILSAKRMCALERSNTIRQEEWIKYVNDGVKKYWNYMNRTCQDYHIKEVFIQTQYNVARYVLPDDFLYVRGFDIVTTPVTDPITSPPQLQNMIPMIPYYFEERGQFSYPLYSTFFNNFYYLQAYYRIIPGNPSLVDIQPLNINSNWVRCTYTPSAPELVNQGDTVKGFNGWDEYSAAWAAFRALSKQQLDTTDVEKIMREYENTISVYADSVNRDRGQRVVDVNMQTGLWGW